MKLKYLLIALFVFFNLSCIKKTDINIPAKELPKLGITVKIPGNFNALPEEHISEISALLITNNNIEPFNINPIYAYAESSGKGILVFSELQFQENAAPEKNPIDNIYLYKKNLENNFGSGEITSEEIPGNSVITLLLALSFKEADNEFFLFKGLSYMYSDRLRNDSHRFFMTDLYINSKDFSDSDVTLYNNMFYSFAEIK